MLHYQRITSYVVNGWYTQVKFIFSQLWELFNGLVEGKNCRKPLYLMVKTMVSCRFSLQPIQWTLGLKIKIWGWVENLWNCPILGNTHPSHHGLDHFRLITTWWIYGQWWISKIWSIHSESMMEFCHVLTVGFMVDISN